MSVPRRNHGTPLGTSDEDLEYGKVEAGWANNDAVHPLTHGSDHGGQPQNQTHQKRPPLLVKITLYRLFTTITAVVLGAMKTQQALENGGNVTATWLDLAVGTIAATILYWVGLYADIEPPVCSWLFHSDYSVELGSWILAVIFMSVMLQLVLPLAACVLMIVAWSLQAIFTSDLSVRLTSASTSYGVGVMCALIALLWPIFLYVWARVIWLCIRTMWYLVKLVWRPASLTQSGKYLAQISRQFFKGYWRRANTFISITFYFSIPLTIGVCASVTIFTLWMIPIVSLGRMLFGSDFS